MKNPSKLQEMMAEDLSYLFQKYCMDCDRYTDSGTETAFITSSFLAFICGKTSNAILLIHEENE